MKLYGLREDKDAFYFYIHGELTIKDCVCDVLVSECFCWFALFLILLANESLVCID